MRGLFLAAAWGLSLALAGCAEAEGEEPAAPVGSACMWSGEFEFRGRPYRTRECLQMSPRMLQQVRAEFCQGLAELPGKLGARPVRAGKVEYLSQCPPPTLGTCYNAFDRPDMAIHYYERSAPDVAGLPAECSVLRGDWKPAQG
jgi:hypothetical protein